MQEILENQSRNRQAKELLHDQTFFELAFNRLPEETMLKSVH
jgi:hypothetical protein